MNSCILMAQIISDPELRSTQDQMSVSTMMVEFESTREGEDPGKVQVEGWGKLAEEIKNTYSKGDQVIIEGRLSMINYDMPEGYKEKRAKLVASRVYPLSPVSTTASASGYQSGYQSESYPRQQPANVVDYAPAPKPQAAPAPAYVAPQPAPNPEPATTGGGNEDWDEIPF